MFTGILGLLALGALVIGALYERRRSYKPSDNGRAWWYSEMQSREFDPAHGWRDFYAPFDGRDLDSHERNHYEQAMIYRACELANQRLSGRWLGPAVNVSWSPGLDGETDNLARWLLAHGADCGVTVKVKK